MIRQATQDDLDAIVRMGMSLLSEPPFNRHWPANKDCVERFVANMIAGPTTAFFVLEKEQRVVGMIGVATFTHQLSGLFIGQEIGWWVDPATRGARVALSLLSTAEHWAASRGVVAFQVQAPTERVGKFYQKLGYELTELSYQKRVH